LVDYDCDRDRAELERWAKAIGTPVGIFPLSLLDLDINFLFNRHSFSACVVFSVYAWLG
jgi:hypothetical protein